MAGITIKTVLDFWFGEIREEASYAEGRTALWFGSKPETDRELRERFGETVEAALRGECDGWASAPPGRLALILLLDQFTRNIFRGTARAFSGDKKAQGLCLEGIEIGADRLLHPIQRSFFYLPLEHSEDLASQRRSITCFEKLAREAPAPLRAYLEETRDYAIRHFAIIERFGRFPHRNKIVGRQSAPEEAEFLKTPGSSF